MELLAKVSWLEQFCNVLVNHLSLMDKHNKLRSAVNIDIDSIWRVIDEKNNGMIENEVF